MSSPAAPGPRCMSTDDTARAAGDPEGYVDLYLLPVPEGNLEAYREQARTFGAVVIRHGGLDYREFLGDDPGDGFDAGPGEVLTAAVAEFRSRAHRDEVMAKVMQDARVTALAQRDPLADMSRMRYGGFRTFVRP
jgi:uncharacterized protein YbaA (DUF1428 family)